MVTIHDCLVTCPESAERVRRIREEAFGSVGVRPRIKITAFNVHSWDLESLSFQATTSSTSERASAMASVDELCERRTGKDVGSSVSLEPTAVGLSADCQTHRLPAGYRSVVFYLSPTLHFFSPTC